MEKNISFYKTAKIFSLNNITKHPEHIISSLFPLSLLPFLPSDLSFSISFFQQRLVSIGPDAISALFIFPWIPLQILVHRTPGVFLIPEASICVYLSKVCVQAARIPFAEEPKGLGICIPLWVPINQ